jgi:hypothetical protein
MVRRTRHHDGRFAKAGEAVSGEAQHAAKQAQLAKRVARSTSRKHKLHALFAARISSLEGASDVKTVERNRHALARCDRWMIARFALTCSESAAPLRRRTSALFKKSRLQRSGQAAGRSPSGQLLHPTRRGASRRFLPSGQADLLFVIHLAFDRTASGDRTLLVAERFQIPHPAAEELIEILR